MKKILCTLMSIMMILAVATGCGQTGGDASSAQTGETGTKVITNCDGTEVTVPEKVDKIGCLFGPSYEKVVLLGAEDKIVFDGDYHINSWPWSNVIYKHLNDVPGITNAHSAPNIEDLMGYEPDLVFNFPNPETTKAMEEAGMYVVPMASNLQIILFRAKSGRLYARFDLNEVPVTLIPGDDSVYIPWSTARQYLRRCLPAHMQI